MLILFVFASINFMLCMPTLLLSSEISKEEEKNFLGEEVQFDE